MNAGNAPVHLQSDFLKNDLLDQESYVNVSIVSLRKYFKL